MEKFIINGGKKLSGSTSIFGSKNVALKVFVAACLTQEEVIVENIPLISDLLTMAEIIEHLGGEVRIEGHTAYIRVKEFTSEKISLEKAVEIRTSYMFLVPLLARVNKAIIPNPGGCRIGARPIDRIVLGLKKMGVKIDYDSKDGYFHASSPNGLRGTTYRFSKNTHTGTETMILAAVLAKGKTILDNAAQEPEIDELINLLNSMGARVKREKSRKIIIEGVPSLKGTRFRISPDRNEIVTFAIAALITEGDIFIKDIKTNGLNEFLDFLKKCGGGYEISKEGIRFYFKEPLEPTNVVTSFYPGFMTDWQGPWAVLMTKANGKSTIHETIYENRFSYVLELRKLGAEIDLYNPKVKNPEKLYNFNTKDDGRNYLHAEAIFGPAKLHNGIVNISDLRAGATLVLAALAAKGESVLFGIEHLDRGYEKLEERLSKLGANIKRVSDEVSL
jgi:UDP-N-acetylglucosamine 1-carboxyvinyltransferase